MRIVIDMQGAQTESRQNGVGRFIVSLVQAVVRNCGRHDIVLALSASFPDSIGYIRDAFRGLLSQDKIRTWNAPGPLSGDDSANGLRVLRGELIREAFLASLEPDVVYLTTLFDGYANDVITSIGDFAPELTTVVMLPEDVLAQPDGVPGLERHRARKLEFLKRAAGCHLLAPATVESAVKSLAIQSDAVLLASTGPGLDVASEPNGEATRLLAWFEEMHANRRQSLPSDPSSRSTKPRLAYVSPLPPERSGIADYSAELLPFLARYYDVDVVAAQGIVSDEWVKKNTEILSGEEFLERKDQYERVLYHFGNNPMHARMFELLGKAPGVVVLHDFFLSGVQWYRETYNIAPNALWEELYRAHGYRAVKERFQNGDEAVAFDYPCNFSVIENALGVVVHSENSVRLMQHWYGQGHGFSVVPLLRLRASQIERKRARKKLGFSEEDFVVCSFGFIGKTKQNHSLVNAWAASRLISEDIHCKLIFVGENDESPYGVELANRIGEAPELRGVRISGWVDAETYRLYLAAADVAVQLRTLSRGETSAAVLDCLNYGLATVVNANGAMADLPADVVWMLRDNFAEEQLVEALEILRRQPAERSALGARGRAYVHAVHSPEACADQYFRSIEAFYDRASVGRAGLISELGRRVREEEGGKEVVALADALSRAFPSKRPARKLFVDVSVVVRDDFKTGIQRAVRALLLGLIDSPPSGYLIEPVYLSDEGGNWHYRYACDYTLALLGCTQGWLPNERVEPHAGDIFVGLDLAGGYVIQADRCGVYEGLMNSGVHVAFVVYDLIPIQFENVYPAGFKEGHADWLRVVSKADSAICISRSVANELADWVRVNGVKKRRPLDIRWFHLGADLKNSRASEGMETNADVVLQKLTSVPSFLLVGTLEPRKGHAQVLGAFELLWERGLAANLVIVGKAGWMVDSLVQKLRAHPELDKRLLWLEGISDEYLERIYAASSCLIAASEGEGFGLPLIEAAQYKVPIIARDLAVFREVAGSHAHYFTGLSAVDLAGAIDEWLELFISRQHPTSDGLPWLTWKESTEQLKAVLLPEDTLPAQESRSALAAKIEGRELCWVDGA